MVMETNVCIATTAVVCDSHLNITNSLLTPSLGEGHMSEYTDSY